MHDNRHHEHDRRHEHGHESHEHENKALTTDKGRMLLKFMLEHNREHTAEIRALAKKLRDAGDAAAAERMESGAAQYDAGDAFLAEALKCLE